MGPSPNTTLKLLHPLDSVPVSLHNSSPRLAFPRLLTQPRLEVLVILRKLGVARARLVVVHVGIRCPVLCRWIGRSYRVRPPLLVLEVVVELVDVVVPHVGETRLVGADYRGAGLLETFLGDALLVVAEDGADVLDLVGDFCQDVGESGVAAFGTRPPAVLEDSIGVLVGCSRLVRNTRGRQPRPGKLLPLTNEVFAI